MPISINEFIKGRPEIAVGNRILNFLRTNPNMAYTEHEIMNELFPETNSSSVESNLVFVSAVSPLHIHELLRKG
jgi:hypothetical protein